MKVSETGQIAIPAEFREALGLTPGTEVEITARDGVLVVRPSAAPGKQMKEWIRQVRGTASTTSTTDEIMAMTRGNG